MSSAKALLAAAGLLKPGTSTATEHAAKLPETSTATEHATSSSQPDTAASKPQASASLSYFSLGDSDLEKIVALLMWMTQNSHPNVPIDDIHHAALEAILKHSEAGTGGELGLLHEASSAKLSELIDIMTLTKDGKPKDPNETLVFMRRVATIREEVRGTSSDNATERFELDKDSVSLCYKLFGRTLLTHDLLPHQKKNKQYCLRWQYDNDTHLTTFQRSWTDNMLRKFLGDKKVATLIWQHGLPSIADPPLYRRGQKPDIGMLQSSLNECLQWYCSLANGIMAHQTQKGVAEHHLASSLDEQQRERQQRRREELQKVKDALQTGAALAKQRDCGKRSYEEMDGAEQKMLEEYETGAAKKAKEDLTLPKLQPFRCELPFNKVGEQCTVEQGASCSSIKLESALQAATGTAAEPCAKRRKRVVLQALLQNTKRRKASTATGCKHAAKRRKKSTATEHATSSSQPDTAASTKVEAAKDFVDPRVAYHGTALTSSKSILVDGLKIGPSSTQKKHGVFCESDARKACAFRYSPHQMTDVTQGLCTGVVFELMVDRDKGDTARKQWTQPLGSFIITGVYTHQVPVALLYRKGFLGWYQIHPSVYTLCKSL